MIAIQLIMIVVILAFFGLKATKVNKDGSRVPNVHMIVLGILCFIGMIFLVIPSFGTIGAGERGVVLRFGAVTGRTIEPGAYFITPFINNVVTMDVQNHAYVVGASAASKDLQVVTTKVTVNYETVPDQVGYVYEHYRREFELRILTPSVQESVKTATALYNAEDLIAQRPLVKEKMEQVLSKRLFPTHQLTGLSITDFDFSPEFNKAIEAKVTATQQALTEKNNRDKKQYLADQIVITAKADAEAIKIKAEAITQQGGENYVRLQWIEAWRAGGAHVPTVIAGQGAPMFLMNLDAATK